MHFSVNTGSMKVFIVLIIEKIIKIWYNVLNSNVLPVKKENEIFDEGKKI